MPRKYEVLDLLAIVEEMMAAYDDTLERMLRRVTP